MPTQLSFNLAGSHREWLILRMGASNPFSAISGPLPRVVIPLEARLTEQGIELEIMRLAFDLKLGNTVIGQGEIGPVTHLRTSEHYIQAAATCPREALPYLLSPSPLQGRVTLQLVLKGLLRYRHSYQRGDNKAQGLGEPDVWHIESIGESGIHELDVQIARSEWYEQIVAPLGTGGYLITPLTLPYGVKAWQAALAHLDEAARALVQANPPAVFGYCRASIDALPGAKTNIFDAMPEGPKRDAINELTKRIGEYIHSGRHVVPGSEGEQAGEFPVDQRDALFAYNMTKLLVSQIYSLVIAP